VDLLYFNVNSELILLVYVLSRHIFFKDTFWVKSVVCFNEQIFTSYLNRHLSRTNLHKYNFIAFIFQFEEFNIYMLFENWTLEMNIVVWLFKCFSVVDIQEYKSLFLIVWLLVIQESLISTINVNVLVSEVSCSWDGRLFQAVAPKLQKPHSLKLVFTARAMLALQALY